jgi:hypothetical protein
MLMGCFPGEQKIQNSRSRRRFVPPVGWEVHQGGFRPQANNRATLQLNDIPGTYGITNAAN